jgi:serine/threonine protein kinase
VGDVRPGAVFAGHRIERVIGRGGVSVVYLAEHLQLGRKVALKVLFPHLADDPNFRDRFIRESRTAAELDHPNIVTVFDAGEVDGLLYLSMRYIDGSDLERVISDQGSLDPWRAVTIVSMIAAALDVAHDEGLVHRDVKPGNILLSHPGSPLERAYLSDFGITKRVSTVTTQGALTRTGQFVGTVDYVAPEQIQGEVIDGRADVYSLGCVLFRSLAGVPPFPRPADVATIYAHLHDVPPPLPLDAPAGMDDVIERALAKSREDRYSTCAALAEAARSHLESGIATRTELPVPARPLGQAPRARRRWPLVAILAAAVAVLVLVVVTANALRSRSPAAPSPAASSGPSATVAPVNANGIFWSAFDWTGPDSPPQGGAVMSHATVTGRGTVIAAGHTEPSERAVVWRRVTNTDWRRSFLPDDHRVTGLRVTGIASIGRRVVAVGYGPGPAMAWYSRDDGVNWSVAHVAGRGEPQAMDTLVVAPDGSLIALGHVGTASQQHGAVWTSTDGVDWSRAKGDYFNDPTSMAHAFGAAALADGVVAAGRAIGPEGDFDAAVWELHGATWSRDDPQTFVAPGEQDLLDVTAIDDRVVAVGHDYETDQPIVWVRDASGNWTTGQIDHLGTGELTTVVSLEDGTLLAAGRSTENGDTDAAVWQSSDGASWARLANATKTDDLEGAGFQSIRTLVLQRPGQLFAFGDANASSQHESGAQAQLWAAG